MHEFGQRRDNATFHFALVSCQNRKLDSNCIERDRFVDEQTFAVELLTQTPYACTIDVLISKMDFNFFKRCFVR